MRYNYPIRVSIIGVGHMGGLHARKLSKMEDVSIEGVWDIDESKAKNVADEIGTRVFKSFDDAVGYSQAVILATPTKTHGKLGLQIIERMRHLFIEKPIASNEEEADILVNLAAERDVVLMVGHIENFNPAFVVARKYIKNPLFIEAHRLTPFRGRGTDMSVVEDLMIHDIEILLNILKSDVEYIDSSAASVLSETPDIANVRLRFENGCIANLTASRISLSQKRKMRIFQQDCYIGVDFDARSVEIIRPADENPQGEVVKMGNYTLEILRPEIPDNDPITEELRYFIDAIKDERKIDCESSLSALKITQKILSRL
ncbi:Gfo/Idh/MocA family oxidoreductase [bacterium]|nr:Gfo/Idh/MocA family oxidoreductase [bacterium]